MVNKNSLYQGMKEKDNRINNVIHLANFPLSSEEDLVVSPEHKVYSIVKDISFSPLSYIFPLIVKTYRGIINVIDYKLMPDNLSFSTNSLVLNTSTSDCFLKCSSFDHIGISLERANAKYDVSSLSGIEEFACSREDSNDFSINGLFRVSQ